QLSEAGVSAWLDDISRDRLRTGNLQSLIDDYHVVGVTSNPTIFAKALAGGSAYDEQVADLKIRGVSVEEASRALTTYDIRWACDVLRPVYDATNGHDLSKIFSVASFFVSRMDTEVDARLDKLGTAEAAALRGKTAIANARLAYELFENKCAEERWRALAAAGANVQRPLWASTSTKDPSFPDTMYVVDLVVSNTVNTMPEATIKATADHGELRG